MPTRAAMAGRRAQTERTVQINAEIARLQPEINNPPGLPAWQSDWEKTALDQEKGWAVVDTHRPLGRMQRAAQEEDPSYSMLKDTIHLTDAAYVGWGFYTSAWSALLRRTSNMDTLIAMGASVAALYDSARAA